MSGGEPTDESVDEAAEESRTEDDHVQHYACDVLTLSLLLMEFIDAIREGDGNRIIRCWRYFLLHFKVANRTNYSVEAFTLLTGSVSVFAFAPNGNADRLESHSEHPRSSRKECVM